jgi:hypothetical protein
VGNDGTDPVTGVKVRDTLPAGARYQATGTNSFLCTPVAGVVDCVAGRFGSPPTAWARRSPDGVRPTPGTYMNQAESIRTTMTRREWFDNNARRRPS